MILAEISNLSFISGAMPESLSLFVFGVGLIVFTVCLRRILSWGETAKKTELEETDER